MRKRFDKSPAIDAASNLRLATMIQNHDELYTKEEEEILKKGLAEFSKFNELKGKKLAMRSPTTTLKPTSVVVCFLYWDKCPMKYPRTCGSEGIKQVSDHALHHPLRYQ